MFMKGKKLLLWSLIMVISLLLWGGTSYAKVTGRCDNCHTMHNSQDGADLYAAPAPYDYLLVGGCVSCHSSSNSSTTYALDTSTVPVVNYTGAGAPTDHLAGGNFYWVADLGGNVDARGHNVLGISDEDAALDASIGGPGAPGNQYGGDCQSMGCHGTLAAENTSLLRLGSGCQGCHLKVRHHANDGTGTKYVDSAAKGWYRFLAHHSGGDVLNYGVKGIEDADWQATVGPADHNEYLGVPEDKTKLGGGTTLENYSMTAFCCGCHGDFHTQNANAATGTGSQSPWLRHPSDFVIPASTGLEYSGMSTSYDSLSPVARPTGFAWDSNTPNGNVAPGTDMVMCLSCHVPHGSANDDLLRWDYAEMVAGGGGLLENQGCFYCHVTKDD